MTQVHSKHEVLSSNPSTTVNQLINKYQKAGDVTQMVEGLPSMFKV
jgi:hypothetical protein